MERGLYFLHFSLTYSSHFRCIILDVSLFSIFHVTHKEGRHKWVICYTFAQGISHSRLKEMTFLVLLTTGTGCQD